MLNSPRVRILIITLLCLGVAVFVQALQRPLWIWNITPSLPKGIYAISADYQRGDIVAFTIPASLRPLVQERAWLPAHNHLLKRIVALEGEVVCIHNGVIYWQGEVFDRVSPTDSAGRPMPQLEGCHTVPPAHVWLMLQGNPLSLDSRYFGAVERASIVGKATLVWTYP